jgi:hypothetical protein
MKLSFEHEFQQKIMTQCFQEPLEIKTVGDVNKWRTAWMQELKSWHSPYKLIIDARQLTIAPAPEVHEALTRMFKFFEGLFLKSAIAFTDNESQLVGLPCEVVKTFEDAQLKAGVRGLRNPNAPVDFRASIQIQNHFPQHVIEVSFSEDVDIKTKEQVLILKSKLTNNLMQWHSKWSLLIDCSRLTIAKDLDSEWQSMTKFLSGFFMKACVGYSPKVEQTDYPFKCFRARHKAVAGLEAEGMFMGNDAHCRTAKPK